MDLMGLTRVDVQGGVYQELADAQHLLEDALEQLRASNEILHMIDELEPEGWSDLGVARAYGIARGLAIGGYLDIEHHMKYVQHDPIDSDQEGGDNHGD